MSKVQNGDFSKGKVSSTIMNLAIPIILAELVHVTYNMVDRMYIGHIPGAGTDALTGLGIALPLITFIAAFANLFGTGGSPLSSIARGEGDNAKAQRILETSFTMMILVGAVLTVFLYIFAPKALELVGGDENTLPYAISYFRIYVLGSIFVLISLGMNPFINAMGFTKIGMGTVMIGAILNIILDPLLIYKFNMGIAGAALATVISQFVSAVWVVMFLTGKKTILRIEKLRIDMEQMVRIFKLGITGFTFRVTNSITQSVVNITLRSWGGDMGGLYIGAMSIINSIREITQLPGSGITTAMQSVIGFNKGAQRYDRMDETIGFCFRVTGLYYIAATIFVMMWPRVLVNIFSADEALIDLTIQCMRIYFFTMPFLVFQIIGQNSFVGLNYPRQAMFFSLLRKIGLILPFTIIFPYLGTGAFGPFWAEAASQIIGGTSCFVTMYHVIWKKIKYNISHPDTPYEI